MPLREIRITALRCISAAQLFPHAKWNYVFGANGAGKTSILESIYLLSRGRSFRTRQLAKLIQHGRSELAVFAELDNGKKLGTSVGPTGLERRVDGGTVRSSAELAIAMPVHVIEPRSHLLIEGTPSDRRRFVDWGVFHVERNYLAEWRDYRRALGQRNAALKISHGQLAPWTAALVQAGEKVTAARRRYIADLAPRFATFSAALLDRPVTLGYRCGWRGEVEFAAALHASLEQDKRHGVTGPGPHRADLSIQIDGYAAASEASRGQQKLAAAALILAQLAVQAERSSQGNVLLLDDPAADLDAHRLERLVDCVRGLQCQVVMTMLEPVRSNSGSDYAVFHVERGVVHAV